MDHYLSSLYLILITLPSKLWVLNRLIDMCCTGDYYYYYIIHIFKLHRVVNRYSDRNRIELQMLQNTLITRDNATAVFVFV